MLSSLMTRLQEPFDTLSGITQSKIFAGVDDRQRDLGRLAPEAVGADIMTENVRPSSHHNLASRSTGVE